MGGNQTLDDLSGGEVLPRTSTIIDLPPPDIKRWVARCNAVIVNAVRSGASIPADTTPDTDGIHPWARSLSTDILGNGGCRP
jgi:Protein of unknown function (DUF1153)